MFAGNKIKSLYLSDRETNKQHSRKTCTTTHIAFEPLLGVCALI